MKYIFVFLFILGCSSQEKTITKVDANGNEFIEIREQDLYRGPDLKNPRDTSRFEYSRYVPITFDELYERGVVYEDEQGMKVFYSNDKVIIKLPAYPTQDLSPEEQGRRDLFAVINPKFKPLIHIYDSKLKVKYKDQNFLILFQSQLVPYMKSELKVGGLVGLYIVHATYDEFAKIHLILVNEFKKY